MTFMDDPGNGMAGHKGDQMKKARFSLLLAAIVIFMLGVGSYWAGQAIPWIPVPQYIAHAGGGIGGLGYTNSLEALEANYRRGHRFFEVDLNWTSDGQLVLIHDWRGAFKSLFPETKPAGAPSLRQFLRLKMKDNLTPMSFSGLARWLLAHPGARIITDVKDGNLRALKTISEECPDLLERIIPQIYSFEEYDSVWAMGYRNIILTLYVANYPDEPVLAFARRRRLFGVTMWDKRAMGNLPNELAKTKTPVFAHTVNSPEMRRKLEANGVSGIYTDFLCGEE
jgi:lipoteichoic acid synthase